MNNSNPKGDLGCIVRCPNCRKRFGGMIADTSFLTWRCKGCHQYTYGNIENKELNVWQTSMMEKRAFEIATMRKT